MPEWAAQGKACWVSEPDAKYFRDEAFAPAHIVSVNQISRTVEVRYLKPKVTVTIPATKIQERVEDNKRLPLADLVNAEHLSEAELLESLRVRS